MLDETSYVSLEEGIKLAMENTYLQMNKFDVGIPYIAGIPGGGKTAAISQLCQKANWNLFSVHFALKPIEENSGIPNFIDIEVNGEIKPGTVWSMPDIIVECHKMAKEKPVILLLDDIHLCSPTHMALLYELFTERKIREYHLPENCGIILAGNHGSNKAGAKAMFSAIINRVALLPIQTTVDEWKRNYAIQNDVHSAIVSFLSKDQFKQFAHEEENMADPWSSFRSWSRLSTEMKAREQWTKKKLNVSSLLYLASAYVSKTAAQEFVKYYKIFMEFDIAKIFQEVDDYELPESMINKYALAFAANSYYCSSPTKANVEPFAKLISKFISDSPDLGMSILHEIIETEKIVKKRLFIPLTTTINKYHPGITDELLKTIKQV